jgi:hypothetical protein
MFGGVSAAGAADTVPARPSAVPATTATTTTTTGSADDPARGPVVVIGTTGLRWDDVGALTTPALWDLSRTGSVGTVAARSLRSFACPADGWLALSAGARADDIDGAKYGECRTLREPSTDKLVPGWADYLQSAKEASYSAKPGLLGDALAKAKVTATGIGPGAAIALSDSKGLPVGEHLRRPGAARDLTNRVGRALHSSRLVVVDAGTVRDPGQLTVNLPASGLDANGDGQPDPGAATTPKPGESTEGDLTAPDAVTEPTRSDQARRIDERIRAVLDAIDESGTKATVLVTSLADSGRQPHLQLAIATGPSVVPGGAPYAGTLLETRSTRQPGYVMPTDLTPTVLSALGARDSAPVGSLAGSPVSTVPGPKLASERVAAMIDQDVHAWAVKPLTPVFFVLLVVVNLVLYALVTLGLNGVVLASLSSGLNRVLPGRVGRAVAHELTKRPNAVLSGLRLAGVAVASFPVATFLANLTPWWRASPPSYALSALIIGWVAIITGVALLPRWKSWLLGPVGVVAAVTAIVIAADITTGGRLQVSAVMGVQPLVGARFYGFNNQAFALFAASTILLAVAIANPLVHRGMRKRAAVVVGVIGVVATALDGLPGVGSDFGGPPALVPAFAVLALLAAGVRIGWGKALAILGAGAGVVIGFAVLDWLRPADSQTHLGRFVQTVLDGGVWPVIMRKGSQNVAILFGSPLTVLAIAGIALVLLVLGRPLRTLASAPDGGPFSWLSAGAPLTQLGTDAPLLRPGLIALTVALGIGFAVNDSGVVIPAVGGALVVPLLVAACASWMLQVRPDPDPLAPHPSPVTSER